MLKEKLLEDLKECMKTKNVIRKNVIQMVRAAILQVEKDKKVVLEDAQIIEIIAKILFDSIFSPHFTFNCFIFYLSRYI